MSLPDVKVDGNRVSADGVMVIYDAPPNESNLSIGLVGKPSFVTIPRGAIDGLIACLHELGLTP